METTTRRYIATTRKHEHKFTISAELNADALPVYQYRGHDLRGWFMNGSVMYRGACPTCGKLVTIPANGKRFLVGSSCVAKSGDHGLRNLIATDVKEHQREVRIAREARIFEGLKALYPSFRESFTSKPHPTAYYASKGKTLADYYDFIVSNSGASGRAWLLKKLKALA